MMEVVEACPNYELSYDAAHRIIRMRFIGDMNDEVYKKFWCLSIDLGRDRQVNRIIIDQSGIGNVSFNARGWVVVNAFPRIKRELPKTLAAAILSSGRMVQKTGMQYLMKAFKSLTGYSVELFPSEEEAISWLKQANKPEPLPSQIA
jgi:hypothetical protein